MAGGTASVAAVAASTVTAVGSEDLSAVVGGDLGELEAGAGVGERRQVQLHDLGLHLVLFAEALNELKGQVAIVHGAPDGVQVISNGL
jgi:hypothetical protein